MAYQLLTDDEYQQQQGQQPVIGAGAAQPDAAPSQQAQQSAQQDGSGKFINFDRYISANRDVASRDANNLAGQLGGDVNNASDQLGRRWSAFVADANSHGLQDDGKQLGMPTQYSYSADGSGNTIGAARQGLSTAPQLSYDDAVKRGNTTYDGPTGLDDTKFYKDWNDFVDQTKTTGTGDTPKDAPGQYTLGDRIDATRSAAGLGVLSGLSGSSGTRTSGGQAFAGGLLGATGSSAFGGLQSRFGDFLGAKDKDVANSQTMATARQSTTNQLAQSYRDQAHQYEQAQAGNAQRLQAAQAAEAQRKADRAAQRADLEAQLTALRQGRQLRNTAGVTGGTMFGPVGLAAGGVYALAHSGESPDERRIRQRLEELREP